MSEFGVGPEDWIEFDLDYVARDHRLRITELLDDHRDAVTSLLGGEFTTEFDDHDRCQLVVDGERRGLAARTAADRLVVTRYLPPDGPL